MGCSEVYAFSIRHISSNSEKHIVLQVAICVQQSLQDAGVLQCATGKSRVPYIYHLGCYTIFFPPDMSQNEKNSRVFEGF